jgi:hypothetical protein
VIKFRYHRERGIFGEIYRPIAEIELQKADGRWAEFHPYIDSGADITLIPYSMGLYLGFKSPEGKIEELRGVRGVALPVEIRKVKMKIGDMELEPRVAWALIEEAPPLLGRLDIFDKFNITFKEKEGVIFFEPVGE